MKLSPSTITFLGAAMVAAWTFTGYTQAQHRVEIRQGSTTTVRYIAEDPKDQPAANEKARKENENAIKRIEAARLLRQIPNNQSLQVATLYALFGGAKGKDAAPEDRQIQAARRQALLAYYQHATHYALGFRPVSQLYPYYVGYPGPVPNPGGYWWGPYNYAGYGYGYGGNYGGFGYGYGNLGRPAFYPLPPNMQKN